MKKTLFLGIAALLAFSLAACDTGSNPADPSDPSDPSEPADPSDPSNPGDPTGGDDEVVYTLYVDGLASDAANIVSTLGWSDLAVFRTELEAGATVSVKADGEDVAFEEDGVAGRLSTTVEAAGTYNIGVNANGLAWLSKYEQEVTDFTVDLWVKCLENNDNIVYAWVYPDGAQDGEGTWYLATHVEETWSAAWNLHYTITGTASLEGYNVIVANFGSESGVDATTAPNATWDGKITQSATAKVIKNDSGKLYADILGNN